MKKILTLLFLAVCSVSMAQTETIRICTYDVLNFSMSNEAGRTERLVRIFDVIKPDIVLVQEITDFQSYIKLADIGSEEYPLVPIGGFHNGPDSDNGIYFNFKKVTVVRSDYYQTALRDIAHFTVQVLATDDTLHIFSVHLKAGATPDDANERVAESEVLQKVIPDLALKNVILTGNFNFYNPEELAYQNLTFFKGMVDPMPVWGRNMAEFANTYTTSPRLIADADCGGGTGGGMDDRFDIIFHSPLLGDNLINGSYTVFGNDGQDRRNASINNPPNTKVTPQIAGDLSCVSDHLPVYADFIFSAETSVKKENLLKEVFFKETSANISVSLPASGTITIFDILGRIVVKEPVDQYWGLQKNKLQSGVYYLQVLHGGEIKQCKFSVSEYIH